MKQKIFLFALIPGFILLFESSLSNSIKRHDYEAYLTISFQNPTIFNDSTSQSNIRSNIETIFENEAIHITHTEKPEKHKLNINVTLRDSLIIEANEMGVGGTATYIVKKPRIEYQYKSEAEIYAGIKDYIKKYL